jgi:hypothetical protein
MMEGFLEPLRFNFSYCFTAARENFTVQVVIPSFSSLILL